jgi:uncharacterized glyoxalase superfamily protein PhnB
LSRTSRAVAFYTKAFGLTVTRRFGAGGFDRRGRHAARLRPALDVHLDVVVDDIAAVLSRAVAAGARAETDIATTAWGRIVGLADPFGHGICLIEFLSRGYDEIAEPAD